MKPVLFSWGYDGWGPWTKEFVQAVDSVEESRGFEAPLFVDVRIRREVRAKGFVGNAFSRAAGDGRYDWKKELGNRCILTGEPGIKIDKPSAARELLSDALNRAEQGHRVLFFCSCKWPLGNWGEEVSIRGACHRHTVGQLVLKYAREQIPPPNIEVIEWPGGEPITAKLSLPQKKLRELRGRKSIPLGPALPPPKWCGLPWGSRVTVHCSDGDLHVVSGPASVSCGEWQLPVLERLSIEDAWKTSAEKVRAHFGLNGRP